jgi:hypothetical protein
LNERVAPIEQVRLKNPANAGNAGRIELFDVRGCLDAIGLKSLLATGSNAANASVFNFIAVQEASELALPLLPV